MPTNKEEVANRLRSFAISNNLKMKDLAAQLGMAPGALQSSYLSGRSLPGAEILIRLHNLGCDIIWLLTGQKSGNEFNAAESKSDIEIRKLRAENEAFRNALSAEVIECILKNVKKGK